MRTFSSNVFVRLFGRLAGLQVRREGGQVIVYAALLLTVLMGLAGAGVDYGLIVIESAKLQNALDAAALAGARKLITSTGANQGARNTEAETEATNFLGYHGYSNTATPHPFVFTELASDNGSFNDTMRIDATIVKPTNFWRVLGIQNTTLVQRATAMA